MIKTIAVLSVVLFSSGLIVESQQTHVSKPVLTVDKTHYLPGDTVVLSGWVSYEDSPTSDVLLQIVAMGPQGSKIFEGNTMSLEDGTFSAEFTLPGDSETGDYRIEIISQCREIHSNICTHQSESLTITVESAVQEKKIPEWVKNIFVWYGEGKVSEEELINAIEFLIRQKIIKI